MKKNISKIQGSSFLRVFCAVLFFTPVSMSFATTCGDLDSGFSRRIANTLCDTLALHQDEDFIAILIIAKGLPDEPKSPPKGTDSMLRNEYFAMNGKKVNLQSMGINSNVASVVISAGHLSNGNIVYKKNPLMSR